MIKSELEEKFYSLFDKKAQQVFFCPGRVNLIGEHIDYNGGEVMPFAISLGTYAAIAKNDDNIFRFKCINFEEQAEIPVQDSYIKENKDWYNYPLGVINYFANQGHLLSGIDFLFYGNLPIGSGLSSSASIEVLTAYIVSSLFNIDVSRKEISLLAKKVENEFIGVNSGIMDQFAVAMGVKDQAILLDCNKVEHQYIPFDLGNYVTIITNTNKPRSLAESKYNERFAECMEALSLLKQKLNIDNLCEASIADFEANKNLIPDSVISKRALHVISENERVKEAIVALKLGDIKKLGELLYASHDSLKELYEVSGVELDTIVEFSKTYAGCAGARMTGAGFGGCAIALVEKTSVEDYSKKLIEYYLNKIGYEPTPFSSEVGDGVREI